MGSERGEAWGGGGVRERGAVVASILLIHEVMLREHGQQGWSSCSRSGMRVMESENERTSRRRPQPTLIHQGEWSGKEKPTYMPTATPTALGVHCRALE